jgi:hypothetical protein
MVGAGTGTGQKSEPETESLKIVTVLQHWIPTEVKDISVLGPVFRINDVLRYGSGSADPYNWFTDPASDPALFFSGSRCRNFFFPPSLFCLLQYPGTYCR